MSENSNRTIEDRLDEIEHNVHEIKSLLLKLTVPKTLAAPRSEDELLNVKELAMIAKVEPSAIYSACAKHEIKFIRFGKSYKFRSSDVQEWIDANTSQKRVSVDEYVDRYLQNHVLKG